MSSYRQGTTATLTVQWYAYPGGPAVNVTGVQIKISPVGGGPAVIGPTSTGVVHEATGLDSYQWAIAAGQATGDYVVLWTGTDPQAEAVQASEIVTVTSATGDLANLAELKAQLNKRDNADDAELVTYMSAAQGVVEYLIDGPIPITTFTERHDVRGRLIAVRRKPLVSVASITPRYGSALAASAYELDTEASTIELLTGVCGPVDLVYAAGYGAAVPVRFKLSGLIIAQHLWRTQHGGRGRGFPTDEPTTEVPGFFAIPNRALELLGGEILPGIA
jgi:hypothetical protein